MSRLFEALQHSELETQQPVPHVQLEQGVAAELMPVAPASPAPLENARKLRISATAESGLPAFIDEMAIASEKFRLLAFRLRQAQERTGFKKLLVTSSVVQDGKSLTSANLAFTLASREKQRVLLIEGDLRQPRIGDIFGIGRPAGMIDWMERQPQAGIEEFIYRLGDAPLWLLPAGRGKLSPLEILHSERLTEMMTQLSEWFDMIVIDSPPLVPLADAHVWEKLADATLLVVREGKTPKKMLEKSLETLDRAKLIGAVLNEASLPQHRYYHYYSNATGRTTPSSSSSKEPQK